VLHQRNVMLPVVAYLAAVDDPFMAGHDNVTSNDAHSIWIQARADHLSCKLARYRIAVAAYAHQADRRQVREPMFNSAINFLM
jgi:hypothetical protein